MTSARLGQLPLARAAHDRAAERRSDQAWLERAWTDGATRVLAVMDGKVPVTEDRQALVLLRPADVPAGERLLLGTDEGRPVFCVRADAPPPGAAMAGLREVGATLGDTDAGLAIQAVALTNWHASHPHCACCGALTELAQAGYSRTCPACAAAHFPRNDPAVIMLVTDTDDRCLLAHQDAWPDHRYSTLAGFVEPGETPERAVVREVAEEVGVDVGEVAYAGSQPWPFPASLMLGYFAVATTTRIRVDGVEIATADWFSRTRLAAAARDGQVQLPGAVSIARALIERWYGGPLPGSW